MVPSLNNSVHITYIHTHTGLYFCKDSAQLIQSKIRSHPNWGNYIFFQDVTVMKIPWNFIYTFRICLHRLECTHTSLWPGYCAERKMVKNYSVYKKLCSGQRKLVPDALWIIQIKFNTAEDPTNLLIENVSQMLASPAPLYLYIL